MDCQRDLRLPRAGEEQRAGRQSARNDHCPLPGRPGVQVTEATSNCEAICVHKQLEIAHASPFVSSQAELRPHERDGPAWFLASTSPYRDGTPPFWQQAAQNWLAGIALCSCGP